MKNIVDFGKQRGYVETIFGRRRYLPELKSSNFNVRSFGERVAMNMPIRELLPTSSKSRWSTYIRNVHVK